jgi:hypothetical protein
MSVEKDHDDMKLQFINDILEMYPLLKKDKEIIISKLLRRPVSNTLERIIYNGQKYYWDNKGNIFDINVNLVGVYKTTKIGNITTIKFYYKQDIDNMLVDLTTQMKKYKITLNNNTL